MFLWLRQVPVDPCSGPVHSRWNSVSLLQPGLDFHPGLLVSIPFLSFVPLEYDLVEVFSWNEFFTAEQTRMRMKESG